jgi:DNA-binding transcriptional MerR regulator
MAVGPFKPVTREDGARILSVSLATLDHLIETGVLPPPRSLGGGRRVYWHPDVFYGRLDELLRSGTPVVAVADKDQEPPSGCPEKPKRTITNSPGTELRSVRSARERDAVRLTELNK